MWQRCSTGTITSSSESNATANGPFAHSVFVRSSLSEFQNAFRLAVLWSSVCNPVAIGRRQKTVPDPITLC
jgi:hypothetical protein